MNQSLQNLKDKLFKGQNNYEGVILLKVMRAVGGYNQLRNLPYKAFVEIQKAIQEERKLENGHKKTNNPFI